MNEHKNFWAALASIIGTFRHDPPWGKLGALMIVGTVMYALVGLLVRLSTQHLLWNVLRAAVG